MSRTPRLLLFLVLAFTLMDLTAAAQARWGAISGRVMDSSHAVLQGARVELTPGKRTVVSDAQGQFTIYGLDPGQYTLSVSYVGFEPFSQQLEVTAGSTAKLEPVLKISAQHQEITVRADRQR